MKKVIMFLLICISLVGCGSKTIDLNNENLIKSTSTEDMLKELDNIEGTKVTVQGRVYSCEKENEKYKITLMYDYSKGQGCTIVYSNSFYEKDKVIKVDGTIIDNTQSIQSNNIEIIE